MDDNRILFVDLDGTLIKEDLSNLAFSHSLKNYPFKTLFYLLVFLFKGKPYLKYKISKGFTIPFEKLTFNKSAFNFIREVKNRHRVVYLISGSHQVLVDQIAKYLNIFSKSFDSKLLITSFAEKLFKPNPILSCPIELNESLLVLSLI